MNSRWYEEFFSADAALDIWQKHVTSEMTHAEVDFLESVFGAGSHAELLDVLCGNGRHSVELARRGFCATGVDIAEENMNRARAKAAAEAIEARFYPS